jgi:D-alanyl-D-alanine dipeptidase
MNIVAIPDLTPLKEIKDNYRTYPIDVNNPLYTEEIVPIGDFGIKGSSYYSNPNKMTGEPLPGINPEALLRSSVAEKLERANRNLQASKDIAKILGGQVELIVRDALRSAQLQQHLFEVVWPKVLKEANPDWDDEKLQIELPKFISKPANVLSSPTPHMTGGAVDVNLIFKDGRPVNFGHVGGKIVSETDYHEGYHLQEEFPADSEAKLARRALYWAMLDEGFINNPTEWWHYSFGDQMWALFNDKQAALYGAVEQAPDLLEA